MPRFGVSTLPYSDQEKADILATLDSNDGNVNLTAKQTGIPRSTIAEWSKSRHISKDVPKLRQEKRESLANLYEIATRAYLEQALDPTVISKSSGQSAIISAATATDKMLLLRGQPTQIVQTQSPDELARELYAHLLAQHFEQSVILEVVRENFPDVPAERLLLNSGSPSDE